MKPPIEYRPKAAPKKAAKAVEDLSEPNEHSKRISAAMTAKWKRRKAEAVVTPDGAIIHPGKPPNGDVAMPGGKWVWVADDQICSLRPRNVVRERMRVYMQKRRAKEKPT